MAVVSKEKYERLKLIPEKHRSNEQREAIVDFERAEAQAPTMAQVRAAVNLHNTLTKNPSLVNSNPVAKQKLEDALKIIEADRAYTAVKGSRVKDAYVQPVQRIPDDLIENNDFNFNWKSAYENVKGEKLRDTEADYDKLKKFIDSNMYELDDPTALQKIAYDFHMYNPNTMKWTDFINSEQGEEFKKYLTDVRENQRKKEVEKIFSGEEPTKGNYPLLGPTDIPGSNAILDFMFPVSKEAAKNAILNNKNPELGGPLAIDAVTNLLMATQPGSKSTIPLINKGSNFLAPAVQNFGNYVFNDTDPVVAGINTTMGGAVNIGTPYFLNRFNRYTRMPGQNYNQRVEVGTRVDQIADKVGNIEKRLNDGALVRGVEELENTSGKTAKGEYYYNHAKKKVFTNNPAIKEIMEAEGYSVSPLKDMRNWKPGILSNKDNDFYLANSSVLRRPFNKNEKNLENAVYDNNRKQGLDKEYKNVAKSMAEGKDISQMDKSELEAILRGPAKETYMNWAGRNMPETVKNYLTNAAGRSQMGTGVLSLPQMIFQTNLGKVVEERKKKKSKISEIFGEQ